MKRPYQLETKLKGESKVILRDESKHELLYYSIFQAKFLIQNQSKLILPHH